MSQHYEPGATDQPEQHAQIDRSARAMPTGSGQGAPAAPVETLFPTRSYLPQEVRTTSIGALDQTLADLSAISMQLRSAHWNVKGQEFYQLHELFEDLIEAFDAAIDEVAERVSTLGGRPSGTAREVASTTTIPALPRETVEGTALVAELADRLAILDANLYEQLELVSARNDRDTADLVNEVSRTVSKSLWLLEAHLQSGPSAGGGGQPAQVSGPSPNSQRPMQ